MCLKKPIATAAGAAILFAAGVQAAHAANTDVDVRRNMAHATGIIVWKYAYQRDGNKWQARFSGRLYNDGDDHVYVQTRVARTGLETKAQKQGKGYAGIDVREWPGDTLQVGYIDVNACESHIGPDRCETTHYDNPNT